MAKRLKKSRYITGFDGVRSLAVIGVILYHLFPYKVQGGFLGVPIFFVLSGYLITDLLVQEWEQNKTIDIKAFYLRRMRRLYPALVTAVLGTVAYITLFQRALLAHVRAIIVTNFLYVYNWFQVSQGESYFDKFGAQSPFTHMWSLSIEGQFYLLWPFVVLLLLRFVKKGKIFKIFLGLSFVSALLMAILYQPGVDPSRVYYGTDTRMFAILIGAALAFIWPSTKLRRDVKPKARLILDVTGILALVLIIIMNFKMSGESAFVYRGGMLLFSLISAVLIAIVAHPGADLNRLLTNPVFNWIGKRSYGIYLYQYPVMVFYEEHVQNMAAHPWRHALIEITLILILSELSYRYLEKPLQKFDYQKTWSVIKKLLQKNSPYGWKRWLAILPTVVVLLAITGWFLQPAAAKMKKQSQLAQAIAKNEKTVAKNNQKVNNNKKTSSKARAKTEKEFSLTKKQQAKASKMKITAVGDSVLADGSTTLQEIFPKMYIDAKVGRQVHTMVTVLQTLHDQGKLAPTILISGGTNGPFTEDDLTKIMQIVGKRKLYWINVHVPTRRWEAQVNDALKAAKKEYKNFHVINWYETSKNQTTWFYDDNVHPNPKGLKHYGACVAQGILK
ncbi:acyltransferase family protein [Ligilactobacillus ceti]|uniref:Acyltransferase n=1 Tax=Ligilactobacillus ceti DSM 22408 TaxID=1122146 RepID=A0A0R2KQY1_9LACO|nr:acyltransferase family protein [Ligilactobacillus ceti]KRN88548.1 acyltransferase [Ligilactobacillus ceti DSM 22408]